MRADDLSPRRVRFRAYPDTLDVPNIVVDGSPNAATVLTLTHWPGISQPAGISADLSAQMALAFAGSGRPLPADVVTNNHFDQDGLVSMLAFVDPDGSAAHEALLVDIARAGDFGTYRFRDAARASMAIAAFADPDRSPIAGQLSGSYDDRCAVLYGSMLDRLIALATDPAPQRELWGDEDDALTASEAALGRSVTIEERPDLDLAIVRIDAAEPVRSGHRFAGHQYSGLHPMAVNNATACFRILQIHGRRYTYTDRYETWVQYRSRRPLPRVDLRPLADELDAVDRSGWSATPPSSLTPQLESGDESSLDDATVIDHVARHLRTAPPAWNPYVSDPGGGTTPG